MNNIVRIFIVGIAITGIITGCESGPPPPTESTAYGNLISNSSFDINGAPSLQGWVASDTSLVHFSTDVPPGGGSYSVVVQPGINPIEGAVYTTVGALAGTHAYRISVWAKTVQWAGDVYIDHLKLNPPAQPVLIPGPIIQDTLWTQYTATDTITANAGDSLTIGLESGSGNAPASKIYFDLCMFTPLN